VIPARFLLVTRLLCYACMYLHYHAYKSITTKVPRGTLRHFAGKA
jgi:hypothetical protein